MKGPTGQSWFVVIERAPRERKQQGSLRAASPTTRAFSVRRVADRRMADPQVVFQLVAIDRSDSVESSPILRPLSNGPHVGVLNRLLVSPDGAHPGNGGDGRRALGVGTGERHGRPLGAECTADSAGSAVDSVMEAFS